MKKVERILNVTEWWYKRTQMTSTQKKSKKERESEIWFKIPGKPFRHSVFPHSKKIVSLFSTSNTIKLAKDASSKNNNAFNMAIY